MKYEIELDIPSAKERFMENEALYKKFLYRFPDDKLMSSLEQHLAEGNIEEAFRDAHTMKGMVGNLSMYRLMNASSDVTEKLRAGQMPDEEQLTAIREAHAAALEAVKEVMAGDIKLF